MTSRLQTAIKYIMAGLLLATILAFDPLAARIDASFIVATAVAFLLYAAYGFFLFLMPSGIPPTTKPSSLAKTIWATIMLLAFRTAYAYATMALLARSAALYDKSILLPGSRTDYISILLSVADWTLPPLKFAIQYFLPWAESAVFQNGHAATLIIRLLCYSILGLLLSAALREIVRLSRNNWPELWFRVQIGRRRHH